MKHGRNGRPRQRFLYCDASMTCLYWRAHDGKPDPDMDKGVDTGESIDAQALQPPGNHPQNALASSFSTGTKAGRRSSFGPAAALVMTGATALPLPWGKSRRSSFAIKADSDRVLLFRDILEVRDDLGTDVMRRSLAKHFVAGNSPTSVVSIVLSDRTLDFEIEERRWGPIFHALCVLVHVYNYQRETQLNSSEREGNK